MAAEQHGTTPDFDLTPHQQMWNAFCKIVMTGVIVVAIVLLLMAYFLT